MSHTIEKPQSNEKCVCEVSLKGIWKTFIVITFCASIFGGVLTGLFSPMYAFSAFASYVGLRVFYNYFNNVQHCFTYILLLYGSITACASIFTALIITLKNVPLSLYIEQLMAYPDLFIEPLFFFIPIHFFLVLCGGAIAAAVTAIEANKSKPCKQSNANNVSDSLN